MSVMIMRFIDLPKKGCFAERLKRPTEMSDATVSVAPDPCVGRRSLFLLFSNRSMFSVSHTYGTNPKIRSEFIYLPPLAFSDQGKGEFINLTKVS